MEQTTAESKIETKEELREFYGPANERSVKKQMAKLDEHARNFIALSPFMVISSATAEGADASPKGDPPGFVKVIDDNTLIIPDRPGNNRVDTMSNIMENNHVGPPLPRARHVRDAACERTGAHHDGPRNS